VSVRLRLSKIRGPGDLGPEQGAQRSHGNGERWITGGRRKFALRHTVIRPGWDHTARAGIARLLSERCHRFQHRYDYCIHPAFRDAATIPARGHFLSRDHSKIADLPFAQLNLRSRLTSLQADTTEGAYESQIRASEGA
jgi:hypothetical protein